MSKAVFSLVVIFTALEPWVVGKLSRLNQQIAMQAAQSTLPLMDATVCRTVPGFTRAQQELCFRQPEITSAALQGLADAMQECQHQFQGHRWNCSTLANKQNPYTSTILHKGYRETAFAYALSAAGVTISVARACSQGSLSSCGCDRNYRTRVLKGSWKWGGCSHNLKFGMRFSKMLLDNRDKAADLHSKINTHNNEVGRRAVADNMQLKCKCHGMSGSCEMKTCWRSTPDMRQVGKVLKDRFRLAILVDQSNLGNDKIQTFNIVKSPKKRKLRARAKQKEWSEKVETKRNKKELAYNLVYYQRSPNFCENDQILDVRGTSGRQCLRNSTGADNCSSLCCGRGYNLERRRRTERCNCKFMWCCKVECQVCTVEEWITVCK